MSSSPVRLARSGSSDEFRVEDPRRLQRKNEDERVSQTRSVVVIFSYIFCVPFSSHISLQYLGQDTEDDQPTSASQTGPAGSTPSESNHTVVLAEGGVGHAGSQGSQEARDSVA